MSSGKINSIFQKHLCHGQGKIAKTSTIESIFLFWISTFAEWFGNVNHCERMMEGTDKKNQVNLWYFLNSENKAYFTWKQNWPNHINVNSSLNTPKNEYLLFFKVAVVKVPSPRNVYVIYQSCPDGMLYKTIILLWRKNNKNLWDRELSIISIYCDC